LSNKIYGGNHTGNGDNDKTRQGRCYAFGLEQNGSPSFKKEFPHHNDTPDFSDQVKFSDPNVKKLKSLKDRWIGLKVIAWPDKPNGKVNFQCWVDDDGLVDGKPANNWKLLFTAEDNGGNLKGEPYFEYQGSKHGGDDIYYMRIDTVTRKTKTYGLSVREIIPTA
jgi:hypothetical protein